MGDHERINKFYEKAEKYGGWKPVSSSRISEIFLEVTQPPKIEFEPIKPLWLVTRFDSDITRFIRLQRLKGASYALHFGLSLAYVPFPYEPRIKWHRTLKSTNPDLSEHPWLFWAGKVQTLEGSQAYIATSLLGEKAFRDELRMAWTKIFPETKEWFEATSSLEGILKKCEEHLSRPNGAIRFVPDPRLVKALRWREWEYEMQR